MKNTNEITKGTPKGFMRRWILKAGATGVGDLVIEDAAIPVPGRGQVRLEIKAVSINYRDQIILSGQYGANVSDIIPLADGAGEIDSLGEGVTRWNLGDRVTTIYTTEAWVDGPPVSELTWGLGAYGENGVLAEYIILSEDRIAPAPKNLNLIEASTLPCAALTAWTALNGDRPYTKPLSKDDKVLVLGTGSVSLFALLLAKCVGANISGTTSKNDKIKSLKDLGASYVVNYKDTENWGDEIYKHTGGVTRVVNAIGGSAIDQSIAAIGAGGEIAYMGLFDFGEKAPNFIGLMSKGASIRGTAVGSSSAHYDLVNFIDSCNIKPPIDKVFGFEDAKAAYLAAGAPGVFGKIVIAVT